MHKNLVLIQQKREIKNIPVSNLVFSPNQIKKQKNKMTVVN